MNRPARKRVAFLCRGTTLPRWQAKAIRQVLEIPGVQLAGLGMPHPAHAEAETGGLRGRLRRRILELLSSSALVQENISDIAPPSLTIEFDGLVPTGGDVRRLADLGAEVVFSFLPVQQEIETASTLPIWQILINGRSVNAQGSAELSAALLTERTARVAMLQVGRKLGAEIELSLKKADGRPTIDTLLHGASWLPAMWLVSGERGAENDRSMSSIKEHLSAEKEESIISFVRILLQLEVLRMRAERSMLPSAGTWNVGLLYQPIATLLEPEPNLNVRWLSSPSTGNHRLEPFGYIAPDGQLNVLYRKRDRTKEFSVVARLRPKSDSVLKRSRSMLSTQRDLEYPFVLERPEGAFAVIGYPHQGCTELFQVASTNDGLDHVKILLDRALSSPTLIEHEGRWWLFGTDPDAPDNILLAFHSERFDGPYTAHTLNPLKTGSVGTRPAGTMFRRGNELWRPTLDPSEPDTSAVILNKIVVLTPDEFQEVPGNRIAGFRGSVYGHGVRTIAAMGDITLIDGIRLNTPTAPASSKERRERHSDEDE